VEIFSKQPKASRNNNGGVDFRKASSSRVSLITVSE